MWGLNKKDFKTIAIGWLISYYICYYRQITILFITRRLFAVLLQ
jgi:hypothetical protein